MLNKQNLSLKEWKWSHSVVSDSLRPHGLQPTVLLCPWDSPGKNTGMGCHSLLQKIFPTQESNPGLLHCRQMLYRLSHQGSPSMKERFGQNTHTHTTSDLVSSSVSSNTLMQAIRVESHIDISSQWCGFAPYFEITIEVLTSELLRDRVTCSRVFSCLWNEWQKAS